MAESVIAQRSVELDIAPLANAPLYSLSVVPVELEQKQIIPYTIPVISNEV